MNSIYKHTYLLLVINVVAFIFETQKMNSLLITKLLKSFNSTDIMFQMKFIVIKKCVSILLNKYINILCFVKVKNISCNSYARNSMQIKRTRKIYV